MNNNLLRILLLSTLLCTGYSTSSVADIYVYEGPNGERLITDRPPPSKLYKIKHHKNTVKHVGFLVANRPIPGGKRHRRQRFEQHITEASIQYGVESALIKAVIQAESNFNPDARSHKDARGLMQLIPSTAAMYKVHNLYNPSENIRAGTKHLRYLMSLFPNRLSLVLAAYNAGEQNVYRYKGIPPFKETKSYVKKVLSYRDRYLKQQQF